MQTILLIELAELPRLLRRMRQDTGLTLKEAGEATGLSFSFISDIERERTRPSLETLEILMKTYGGRLLIARIDH